MELNNNPSVKNTFFQKWTNGRLSRIDFLFGHIMLSLFGLVLFYVLNILQPHNIVLMYIAYVVYMVVVIFIHFGMSVRRSHDFNQGISFALFFVFGQFFCLSGRFFEHNLIGMIGDWNYVCLMLLGISMILPMYFLKDKNENSFGIPPRTILKMKKLFLNDLIK